MKTTFHGFLRWTPVPIDDAEPVEGRLRVQLQLAGRISEFHDTPVGPASVPLAEVPATVGVDLYGPGDVARLLVRAIARTSPPDGAGDVDGEFCPFVEFRSADLPWRYSASPQTTAATAPWLALVAGVENSELGLDPDGALWLSRGLASELDPALAVAWAHVQGDGDQATSRLLCPRATPPGSQCLAALVPLLKPAGHNWWVPGQPAHGIPVLHTFRFTTNEAGSFEDLVAALHPLPPPDGLGRVTIHADVTPGTAPAAITTTHGALVAHDAPALAPLPDPAIRAAIDARLEPAPSSLPGDPPDEGLTGPAPVLGAPRWSSPFANDEGDAWVGEVDTDPRHRAAAGLGARAAAAWQDRILTAAADRLGQTQLAAVMLRNLTAGVALAAFTVGRRPTGAARRLAFHGPTLANVLVERPGTDPVSALAHLCPSDRALPPALLSAAAAHLLRPCGPTARASGDPAAVSDMGSIIEEALDCPDADEPPLPVFTPRDATDWRILSRVLADVDLAHEQERGCGAPDAGWLDDVADRLDEALRPDGVPVDRVVSRIAGLHERWDVPLEVRPDLDIPLWDWLREQEPDWLLPGSALITRDCVVALRSERSFIAAALLGASRQAVGELRWRGVPIAHGWMPMRTFWQNVASPEQRPPLVDLIQPSSWPSVGLEQLPGPQGNGQNLVIALRSDLVRRYPDTHVYLAPSVRIAGRGSVPVLTEPIWPSFTGRICPDVWFFGFPRPPEDLPRLFVVLEEPDRGPRFRPPDGHAPGGYRITRVKYLPDGTREPDLPPLVGLDDGAKLAAAAYDRPIRAVLDGQKLEAPA